MQNFIDALLDQGRKRTHGFALALTGTNGVGKTTFMGKLRSDFSKEKLSISFCSQKPLVTLQHWRVQDLIQYLETEWALSLDLNVLESLHFKKEMGISKLLPTPVMHLSGGENQIIKLYFCLARKADFYFLDEPSTFLDSKKKEFLLKVLRSMKERGRKFFFIEHDKDFMQSFADEVWEMQEGSKAELLKGDSHV